MAVISSLSILLKADSSMFINSMKKVVESLKAFGRWAMRVAKWVTGIGIALSGLSLFNLSRIFGQAMKEADGIGKLSDEIGATVDSMFALKHAAEITGTTFSVMSRGLQRMNRRIGEAAQGYGEAVKGIRQLGLDTQQLMKMGAFEQFSAIASAMRNLGSQTQKAAAMYTLFGRQGQALINTFQLGKDGLKGMADEVKHLLGSFTRDEFKVFEEMNDSVVRLKLAAKGLMLRLGNEFSQIIGAGLSEITELLVSLRENHLPAMAAAVRSAIRSGIEALQRWLPMIVTVGEAFLSIGIFIWNSLKGLGILIKQSILEPLMGMYNIVASVGASLGLWEAHTASFSDGLRGITRLIRIFYVSLRNIPKLLNIIMVGAYVAVLNAVNKVTSAVTTAFLKLMVAAREFKIWFGKLFEGDNVSTALLRDAKLLSKAKKNLAEATERQKGKLSIEELFDSSGLTDDIEDLWSQFNEGPTAKGGFADKLIAALERIKNFKLGIPPVNPSGQLLDVAKRLSAFSSAVEYGSQQAVEVMSRAGLASTLKAQRDDPMGVRAYLDTPEATAPSVENDFVTGLEKNFWENLVNQAAERIEKASGPIKVQQGGLR